jgi:hypothetical protein
LQTMVTALTVLSRWLCLHLSSLTGISPEYLTSSYAASSFSVASPTIFAIQLVIGIPAPTPRLVLFVSSEILESARFPVHCMRLHLRLPDFCSHGGCNDEIQKLLVMHATYNQRWCRGKSERLLKREREGGIERQTREALDLLEELNYNP